MLLNMNKRHQYFENVFSNKCFNLIFSLAHFVHRFAPVAQNAPSPSGTKIQVKPMLGTRLRRRGEQND